ncbi:MULTISPECIES: pyridoxamine 5'-phosphate oxidase family protein [unclassified Streptomyces]|uniref:pyridoxamine 5'-phosphate oxidase family protein n=1 Tax=unclassified Streptomyces TaxID=2593676 RepID=UPI001660BF92|nr:MULTISPECIES: pyridoxamine 5'-phosphate oxidase family protein [unclassified Streptomyces]MBD0712296.1 pyridoxamine 5'-phosphate oxidase [Streptomyces sp. CBMA291]MBD0714128.1 pyridoxamine 5'-phosphate oxidase [Streptomyces sp. CBMA370]
MGKTYERIDERLRAFIEEQLVFFTATAPLSGDGHVNLSPKGRKGTLVVLDELTLAYVDFGGSGAETIAHLREPGNGRITLMWTAFSGPPTVVRVHGAGEVVLRDDPRWPGLFARFPAEAVEGQSSARAIILVRAQRVASACGFAVPVLEFQEERSLHAEYFNRKTDEEFSAYCEKKEHIATSLDGLPALPLPLPPQPATGPRTPETTAPAARG